MYRERYAGYNVRHFCALARRQHGLTWSYTLVRTALQAAGLVRKRRPRGKHNSPFHGLEGQGWFLSVHCLTRYVKVAFFRGTSLRPVPPGESQLKDVRYLHIHESDQLDEELVASWIRQASKLPGAEYS